MSKKLIKLFKRPTPAYQNLSTFTLSMEEFAALAQGHVDRIYVHDQDNRLRVRLDVKEVLKKAIISARVSGHTGWGFYIVDYSPLNKKETLPEKRKPAKAKTSSWPYFHSDDGANEDARL